LREIEKKVNKNVYIDTKTTSELLHYETLTDAVKNFEDEFIKYKIDENGNNITKTAKKIGIERSTLYRKLHKKKINNTRDRK